MRQFIFLTIFLFLLCISESGLTAVGIASEAHIKVHGRLAVYNGTPALRIWVIGTKRILGIPGGDTEPADMPKELEDLLEESDPLATEIYADFEVTPLSKQKPGEMQFVHIDSVENIIVYVDGKLKKKLNHL